MNKLEHHPNAQPAIADRLPYPGGWMKKAFHAPVLFWRMGYGPLIGRLVLVLAHIGRKTGKVRHTALEYHRLDGRIYVFSAWSRSDWFQNIQAEPRVTIQTHQGTLPALAHRLQTDAEYYEAHRLVETNLMVRTILEAAGVDISLAAFINHKDQFPIVTFDETDLPTPPPLPVDLRWVTPVVLGAYALGYLIGQEQKD